MTRKFFKIWAGMLPGLLLLAGCATPHKVAKENGKPFAPSNIYRACMFMPMHIKRVAILPVTGEPGEWQADSGRMEMAPILFQELTKTRTCEVLAVTAEQLKAWTGTEAWKAEQKLPSSLFDKLKEALGCDAVLFAHLQRYHAFAPMVVGWRLKLVDLRTNLIVWAADEVFDSSEPAVSKGAALYWKAHAVDGVWTGEETERLVNSPRRFGQFSLACLLGTLPAR